MAAVSTGFPAGQIPLAQQLDEIRGIGRGGAAEIDIVISRAHVLTGTGGRSTRRCGVPRGVWRGAHEGHPRHRRARHAQNVAQASLVAMMAGADFIKTSTGKESVNATLPVGLVMARAIRDYQEQTGYRVGLQAGRWNPHREAGAGVADP